jgi:hypothetical protein
VAFELDEERPLVIRSYGRAIMSEDVTDHSLLEVNGFDAAESLDESALDRVLQRILAASGRGPSNSFSASI